ncbi:MAG: SDR family NAD(P)-dependent oxidoreductase, partial [Burkholderiaceae bacterium]
HGAVEEVTEYKFDAVIALNVRAPLLLSKEIIEDWLIQGKGGSIIFISSQLAHVGMSNRSVYSASKSAIEGLSRSLAVELAQERIRVNTVCPTFTLTEMTAKALEDSVFRESVVSKIPLGRLGTPNDYLGVCLLLASDAGGFITGASFRVDGGWTAQ